MPEPPPAGGGVLLVVGFGMGLCGMAVTEALSGVEPGRLGQASGLLQTLRQLGGSLGVAVTGAAYAKSGLAAAYLIGAVAPITGFVAVLVWLPHRRPRRRAREHPHQAAAGL